jgi:hypothetical protein
MHGCANGLSTSARTLMPHCFFPRDRICFYVAHQMGHSTVAMVVRHYARWTHKRHGSDAARVQPSLAVAGLSRQKCQKFTRKRWIQTLLGGIVIGRKPAELQAKLAVRRGGRVVEGTRLLIPLSQGMRGRTSDENPCPTGGFAIHSLPRILWKSPLFPKMPEICQKSSTGISTEFPQRNSSHRQ